MEQEIKEVENTDKKAVYQIGEGKDALTFSITKGETTYRQDIHEGNNPWTTGYRDEKTGYIELKLLSNDVKLYSINIKGMKDAGYSQLRHEEWGAVQVNITEKIAESLYDDNSKGATAVKEFLKKIEGNKLIDELRQLVGETPQRRQKAEQERRKREIEEQKRAEEYWENVQQKQKDAKNALNKFLGVEDAENKFLGVEDADDPDKKSPEESDNKLARVRREIAKKFGLEDKPITPFPELNKRIKKVEGDVSKLIFEKKGGKSGK